MISLSLVESLICLAFTSVSVLLYYKQRVGRVAIPPPGPPGLPFIGHALQIPKHQQWLRFDQWAREYGDIFQFHVFGQKAVVISSIEVALDLLDSRGGIYSDRPTPVMAAELAGWGAGLGYARGPSQARFRELRRIFHHYIGPRPSLSPSLVLAQQEAVRQMIKRILTDPKDFVNHSREAVSSLLLRITYGYHAKETNDHLVQVVEDAMQGFGRASEPGAFWVDNFPVLKYIPAWIPFAGFQHQGIQMNKDRQRMYDEPFNYTKDELIAGRAEPSFCSEYLKDKQEGHSGETTVKDEEILKAAAASLYSGGAETTYISLITCLLALTIHPEVQDRAQAEVDMVLGVNAATLEGPHQLPTLSDRANMPYLEALICEVYRWNPVVPLGLPHRVTRDDVCRGYLIKEGTVIWPNIWAMANDERYFPEPQIFKPERFLIASNDHKDAAARLRELDTPGADPNRFAFGFGRRICPGQSFADNLLFLAISGFLATSHIEKARDADGNIIEPKVHYDGFIAQPAPFACRITSRYDIPIHEATYLS